MNETPCMNKQRGGTVSLGLAVLLLVVAMGEAAVIRHLLAHRAIEITVPQSVPHRVGIVPWHAYSCGSPGAICFYKT